MRTKGFTLLELLVVISIIGILVAVAAVSFTTAQKQSRDSRRRGDIKAIQNAFEQYNSTNNGAYAVDCASMLTGNLQGNTPTDPKTGAAYLMNCTTSAYCVCGEIEQLGTGNALDPGCNATDPAYSSGTGNEIFWCASNLQ